MEAFLEIGKTYIEKDFEGRPTGSMYKYLGIMDRANKDKEHEFQCIEFDCEDDFLHFDSNMPDSEFESFLYKQ